MTRTLGAQEIEDLAVGAWILGTGGGGNPYLNLLNVRGQIEAGHSFELIQPEDLDDDAAVAVVSTMGAPVVMQERLQGTADVARAVEIMADYLGRPFDAVMAVEMGGSNSLQPFAAAAHLDLPIVDADAMGRAFPEAQMTSFAVGGLQPWPLALVDPRGIEAVITHAPTWKWMERASRSLTIEVGSIAATCKAPRTGREVKDWGIPNTATLSISLGEVVRQSRAEHRDPVTALCEANQGRVIFSGKLVDVERRATDGFLRGYAQLDGLDDWAGRTAGLDFQNEWSVAYVDNEAVATVPHLICMLDSVSGEAVGTETARYGQRVTLVVMPSPGVFTTPVGLDHVGPRAFGLDLDVVDPFP
ncbi:MAG: DUF917 domain-containing protein [Actinomycetia bacterium]|nr:DUF917 domain-containing protein [Actinomycetes bacterium]